MILTSDADWDSKTSLSDEEDPGVPFNKAGADRSFERSVVSSDGVGRSLGHHLQICDLSSDLQDLHVPNLRIIRRLMNNFMDVAMSLLNIGVAFVFFSQMNLFFKGR